MIFNATKFEVIKFGSNDELKSDFMYMTPNAEDIINEVNTVKDLGVHIDGDLKFNSHVSRVISKVKQIIGWTLRNFVTRDHFILKTIWKTIIQPHIDYCSPLWFDPNNLSQIYEIENLQRMFTKRFAGLSDMDYWDRLKLLNMLIW